MQLLEYKFIFSRYKRIHSLSLASRNNKKLILRLKITKLIQNCHGTHDYIKSQLFKGTTCKKAIPYIAVNFPKVS